MTAGEFQWLMIGIVVGWFITCFVLSVDIDIKRINLCLQELIKRLKR